MSALRGGPTSPTDLAAALDTANETVSRLLRRLSDQGLVQQEADQDDRRRRLYTLTEAGYHTLNSHDAVGSPGSEPPPIAASLLEAYLDLAVSERRRWNRLDGALVRSRVVAEAAQRLGALHLETRARHERATTLRQAERRRDFEAELDELESIATGVREGCDLPVLLQASAHLEYERARDPWSDESLTSRSRRLSVAADFYGRLHDAGTLHERWLERKAWALVGRAEILREQGRIDSVRKDDQCDTALRVIEESSELFSGLGDVYGSVRCAFLQGFFCRLKGDYEDAWTHLEMACNRAQANGFERFYVEALTQMGDVRRLQRQYDEARELLRKAHDTASEPELHIFRSLAECALGATEFDAARDAEQALRHLRLATFPTGKHPGPSAMALRRQAVATRELFREMAPGEGADKLRDEAVRLSTVALECYQKLGSASGCAQCLISRGRVWHVAKDGDRRAAECRRLVRLVSNPRYRDLLVQDPWVPAMLWNFVLDVGGDQELHELARHLCVESSRRGMAGAAAPEGRLPETEMAVEPLNRIESPVAV